MTTKNTINKSPQIDTEILDGIASKINKIPKMDFYNSPPDFSDEERLVLNTLRPIVSYLIYDEVIRLNTKIRNHHHISLSVADGMKYRENGMNVNPKTEDTDRL